MSLIDRVSAGLDQIGKKAVQAIDESKLRIELGGVRRRKDGAARDLGYLTYRQSKGEVLPEGETDFLIRRIAKAEEEAAKLEAQIAAVRSGGAPPAAEAGAEKGPGARSQGPDKDQAPGTGGQEPGGSQAPEARAQEPGSNQ
jgi:hypothetical protein